MPATSPIGRSSSPGRGTDGTSVSSRHPQVSVGFAVAVIVMVVATGYVTLFGGPSFGNLVATPSSPPGSGLTPASAIPPGCNPTQGVKFPTRTALLIPNYNPATNVTVGDHVDVTFEFNVSATTVLVAGLNVNTPTVFVTMPTVGGPSFPVTFNNHTFTMTGPRWTSLSYSKLVSSNFKFDPAKNATLSTQKVGTMADTPYGTLMLEWRWTWNVTSPNGSYVQGPWTVPTSTIKANVWLSSIFKPAPYVALESESPAHDLIGSNYTMNLGGDVAGRSFYIELENASGAVKATEWVEDTSTTNATFEANITLLASLNYLYPGQYLVHIHDSCGAMLYSKRVTLAYPATAAIQIFTTPFTCGTITLNRTVYRDGQTATVVPSPNPYAFSFQACKGYVFSNYSREGAIHIPSKGLMVVSANGTFIANYRPN